MGPVVRFLLFSACVLLPVLAAAPGADADAWADARKTFRQAQKSEDLAVRRDAYVDLLDYDGDEAAQEVLSGLSKEDKRPDGSPAVLLAGIQTLSTFISEGAQQVLADTIRKGKGEKRLFAVLALADRPAGGGEDMLLELLGVTEDPLVAQAALALGRRKAKQALPAILALLESPVWQLRSAGARSVELMAGPPELDAETNEMVLPPLPEWMDVPALLAALATSLETAEGRARGDIVSALVRLSQQDYGYDTEAWRKLAGGTPAAKILVRPVKVPYVCGIPIYGRRVVVIIDISTCTDDTHPFQDLARLKEVCQIPNARPVAWYEVRTTKQFYAAHAKRMISDFPTRGQKFEVIAVFQKAEGVFGKLAPCNTGTQKQALTFIDELSVRNGPNHFEALTQALDISGGKDRIAWSLGPDEVILLSCSVPWAPGDTSAVTGQRAVGAAIGLKARMRMVPIHCVGVGPHPFQMMSLLAEQTGGTYLDLSR